MELFQTDGTTPMKDSDILALVKDSKTCAILTLTKARRDAITRAHENIDQYVNKYMRIFADDLIVRQAADDEETEKLTLKQQYKLLTPEDKAIVDAKLAAAVTASLVTL